MVGLSLDWEEDGQNIKDATFPRFFLEKSGSRDMALGRQTPCHQFGHRLYCLEATLPFQSHTYFTTTNMNDPHFHNKDKFFLSSNKIH